MYMLILNEKKTVYLYQRPYIISMENPQGLFEWGVLVGPCGYDFREAISKYCYCFSIDRGLIKYLQIKLGFHSLYRLRRPN